MEKLFGTTLKTVNNSPGIYYLKFNEVNYIGSSINLKTRLLEHRTTLKRGKHNNPRMQNTFNKYGEEKVLFSILESNVFPPNLLVQEKYWIDLLNPVLNNKLDPVAQTNCRVNSKEVHQFDLLGRFIQSYPSTKEAQRVTKIDSSSIAKCCNKKLKQSGKYLWSYNKRASAVYDLERSKWKWRKVIMIDTKTNKKKVFVNISKAARHLLQEGDNFNSLCATISSLAGGKGLLMKKRYKFRYKG